MIGKVSLSPAFSGKVVVGRNKGCKERTIRDLNTLPDGVKGQVLDEFFGLKQEIAGRTPRNTHFAIDFEYHEKGTQQRPNKPTIAVFVTQEFPNTDKYRRYMSACNTEITSENRSLKIEKMFDDSRTNVINKLYIDYDGSEQALLDMIG